MCLASGNRLLHRFLLHAYLAAFSFNGSQVDVQWVHASSVSELQEERPRDAEENKIRLYPIDSVFGSASKGLLTSAYQH
jgi:hypothetical protein